jgi:hypothetical protein
MISWPNLGYADAYSASFAIFERMQKEGAIAADVRLQLQYPTPLASMAGTVAPENQAAVAPSYERALCADLNTALERLSHDRVAVQWDVAVEFGALEGAMGPRLPVGQIVPGLVRCIETVPADVPVGMHLCYGDYGHQHFMQPESLQMQVEVVNAVTSAAHRPVDFVSFTVPQGPNLFSRGRDPARRVREDQKRFNTRLQKSLRSVPTVPLVMPGNTCGWAGRLVLAVDVPARD